MGPEASSDLKNSLPTRHGTLQGQQFLPLGRLAVVGDYEHILVLEEDHLKTTSTIVLDPEHQTPYRGLIRSVSVDSGVGHGVVFSKTQASDGRFVLSYDLKTKHVTQLDAVHTRRPYLDACLTEGLKPIIVSACDKRELVISSGSTGKQILQADEDDVYVPKRITCVKAVPQWNQVFLCGQSRDKKAVIVSYDSYTLGMIQKLETQEDEIVDLDFALSSSAGEATLTSGQHEYDKDLLFTISSSDKVVKVWSGNRSEGYLNSFQLSNCGRRIMRVPGTHLVACAVDSGLVEIFDIRGGRSTADCPDGRTAQFWPHASLVERKEDSSILGFSPMRYPNCVASCADDGHVSIWRLDGKLLRWVKTEGANHGICRIPGSGRRRRKKGAKRQRRGSPRSPQADDGRRTKSLEPGSKTVHPDDLIKKTSDESLSPPISYGMTKGAVAYSGGEEAEEVGEEVSQKSSSYGELSSLSSGGGTLSAFLKKARVEEYAAALADAGVQMHEDLPLLLEEDSQEALKEMIPAPFARARLLKHIRGAFGPDGSLSSSAASSLGSCPTPPQRGTQPSPSKPWLLSGSTVSVFKRKKLGSGTFGVVYAGEMALVAGLLVQKVPVAVKRVSTDRVPRYLVEKEVEMLAEQDHPSVLHMFGCYFDEEFAWIVTELCDNGDLEVYVRAHPELSLPARIRILAGVAEGMADLHSKGIFHRDLKPSNVLLTKDLTPKICDFGIAKHAGSMSGQTHDIGTPRFMADEFIFSTPTSRDVYAFGILAYEVLSGRVAFSDLVERYQGIRLVKEIHASGKYPDFEDSGPGLVRGLRGDVKAAVRRCWAAKPPAVGDEDGAGLKQMSFAELADVLKKAAEET